MANTVTFTNNILGKAFVGVSEFRFHEGDTLPATTGSAGSQVTTWSHRAPIVRDSFKFQGAVPNFTETHISGQATAYTSVVGDYGKTEISFTVPSIDDKTTGWLFNRSTAATAAFNITEADKTWTEIGGGILLTPKPLKGMVMIVSEDGKYAVMFRGLSGFAAPIMDNDTTPIGFKVTLSYSGKSDPSKFDMIFYELK